MIFSFGIPKKHTEPPVFSWRPFIVLGIIFIASLGLRAYHWVRGPLVPTATVPAVSFEEVVSSPEELIPPVEEVLQEELQNDVQDDVTPPVQEPPALPSVMNLAVPFISQAPFGIWDAFTEETCEEASFAMVSAYYAGEEGDLDPTVADAAFRNMVTLQESLGYGVSISAQQFVDFANAYDSSVVRVVENPSLDDLRKFLANGHPVIIPAFGRRLKNPFFSGEGPLYHMLVLRGYTETAFIANDPGTRHGENYQYPYDVLLQAIGDWDGDSPDGGARVLVFDRAF